MLPGPYQENVALFSYPPSNHIVLGFEDSLSSARKSHDLSHLLEGFFFLKDSWVRSCLFSRPLLHPPPKVILILCKTALLIRKMNQVPQLDDKAVRYYEEITSLLKTEGSISL